jgi:hypothetical protein
VLGLRGERVAAGSFDLDHARAVVGSIIVVSGPATPKERSRTSMPSSTPGRDALPLAEGRRQLVDVRLAFVELAQQPDAQHPRDRAREE